MSKYSRSRHPNLIQVYAVASSNGICATIFHDELIPLDRFVQTCSAHSPLWAVYVLFCSNTLIADLLHAHQECYPGRTTYEYSYKQWLRSGNGRLCVDLIIARPLGTDDYLAVTNMLPGGTIWESVGCFEPQTESHVLSVLPLYHWDCDWGFMANDTSFSIPASSTVYLGAVVDASCRNVGSFLEMAEMSSDGDLRPEWGLRRKYGEPTAMQNGWTCVPTCDIRDISIATFIPNHYLWISQANYIFKRLQITSEQEKYVFTYHVRFRLGFEKTLNDCPPGYLFLCPGSDFQVGPLEFRWPQCPAYWSLDESGKERLGEVEAHRLGFPNMTFATKVCGLSWHQNAYTAVAKLHQAKGFDPYTQDAARHLEEPLFHVSTKCQHPFARIDNESVEDFQLEGDNEANDGPGAALDLDAYDARRLDVDLLPSLCDCRRWTETVQFVLIVLNTLLAVYGRLYM
ncbi:hypothetical protein FB45DRAFT_941515 [Roridomyces roridus]|uniref:Uncharacterized protein n=1 Tax=Roridomyces roridus TaxID=1738132 RepID=A0AAD7F9T7_9AGAR|nr:hypothetical protein FB45DRAFT_951685 [Roridomyces roridus]KAJ7611309.1 hypothetical protein FB45DRAFT_941515 [Roridomyces roridus]